MFIAQNIGLNRGMRPILRGIEFSVPAGQSVQFIGGNGSGKTSLLRGLAGLLPLCQGGLIWRDHPYLPKLAAREDAAPKLAWVGCDEAIKPDLTLLEHLQFFASLSEGSMLLTPSQSLARLGLAHLAQERAGRLSHGQKKRLGLARLLLSQADLWLIDEPFNGLDRAAIDQFIMILLEHQTRGGILLLASHLEIDLPQLQRVDLRQFRPVIGGENETSRAGGSIHPGTESASDTAWEEFG